MDAISQFHEYTKNAPCVTSLQRQEWNKTLDYVGDRLRNAIATVGEVADGRMWELWKYVRLISPTLKTDGPGMLPYTVHQDVHFPELCRNELAPKFLYFFHLGNTLLAYWEGWRTMSVPQSVLTRLFILEGATRDYWNNIVYGNSITGYWLAPASAPKEAPSPEATGPAQAVVEDGNFGEYIPD